jgi:hypothetical protein
LFRFCWIHFTPLSSQQKVNAVTLICLASSSSSVGFVRKDDILNVLIAPPFFDPDLTILDDSRDKDVIEFVRTCALDVLLARPTRPVSTAVRGNDAPNAPPPKPNLHRSGHCCGVRKGADEQVTALHKAEIELARSSILLLPMTSDQRSESPDHDEQDGGDRSRPGAFSTPGDDQGSRFPLLNESCDVRPHLPQDRTV